MTRKVVRDIELSFIYPPIPYRNCDWQATRKGYDEGDLVGRGRSPTIALADLQELDAEEIDASGLPEIECAEHGKLGSKDGHCPKCPAA